MVRALAVAVAIAAGIRITVELLTPIWPYLLVVLIAIAVLRTVSWWRGRW